MILVSPRGCTGDLPMARGRDDRFTLAIVLDVGEVLTRHGYPAPVGGVLVDLTTGLYRALHPTGAYLPQSAF
jgi:hypothetical protein